MSQPMLLSAGQSGMPTPPTTLRALARCLGLSRTTVSDALRGTGRVDPNTARRVRQVAEDAGYRRNPLATALMTEMKRSHTVLFRGVLAAIDFEEHQRPGIAKPFHAGLMRGAESRAAELGFKLERFVVGDDSLPVRRLDEILRSRGIHGILVLPAWQAPDLSLLDWSRYAGVYTDYIIKKPALHSFCSDHYRTMISALVLLAERGYRRPGLCMETLRDDRLQKRHSAAFSSFQHGGLELEHVPPLRVTSLTRERFKRWFIRHAPDVVICHFTEVIGWMEECGAKVPETHGFVSLNTIWRDRECAGFDLQPELIGARACESIVAQLFRNELGLPEWPMMTTIPSRWTEGPTLKQETCREIETDTCGSPILGALSPANNG